MSKDTAAAVAEYVRLPDLAAVDARAYRSEMFALADDLGAMADESDLPLPLLGDIAIAVLAAIASALTAFRQLLEGISEWPMSSSAR